VVYEPFNPAQPEGIQVHALHGNPQEGAFAAIVKIPAGTKLGLHSHSANFSGATLSEGFAHWSGEGEAVALPVGSAWSEPAGAIHNDECVGAEPCVIVVFFDGKLDTVPADALSADGPKGVTIPGDAVDWKLFNPEMPNGPEMAMVNGSMADEGMWTAMIKFPAGMQTNVHTHSANFVGALISGPHSRGAGLDSLTAMTPGSVWTEIKDTPHMEKCGEEAPCIFVGTMDGKLDQSSVEIQAAEEEASGSE
jgi:quercetin dioxygenase-like cupin family protein